MILETSKIPSLKSLGHNINHLRGLFIHLLHDSRSKAFVDATVNPKIALITHPMVSVLLADPNDDYSVLFENKEDIFLLVPQNEQNSEYQTSLLRYFKKVVPYDRWALSYADLSLDLIREKMTELPDGYEMKRFTKDDESYFNDEMGKIGHVTYGSISQFLDSAIVFGIIDKTNDILVSTCSGVPFMDDELEIDVRTRDNENYRRKGLAFQACLKLMEYALENNKSPAWDAANPASRDLALKLGFTNPIHYLTYLCLVNN
ncbi:MAG: GNAT family N-acetyltransferase [Candidatus Heimdallarchaeota archaeon]|nr:GNAT family N-acetyltransferase [Candidatus Heimdallarchaeota archaeon]